MKSTPAGVAAFAIDASGGDTASFRPVSETDEAVLVHGGVAEATSAGEGKIFRRVAAVLFSIENSGFLETGLGISVFVMDL